MRAASKESQDCSVRRQHRADSAGDMGMTVDGLLGVSPASNISLLVLRRLALGSVSSFPR